MANGSLAYVVVSSPGTPVVTTTHEADPTAHLGVHSYLVEVGASNVGNLYVGGPLMNKATGVDVYAVLPPPTTNIYPSFSSNIVEAAAGFAMERVYLDADNGGDKALVSYVVA
jgi:hypothetical protein